MPHRERNLRFRRAAVLLAAAALVASACDVARPVGGSTDPCTRCHGSDGVPAPPRTARGLTSTTEVGVGAHRRHLADGPIRRAIRCEECHVVPTQWDGHFDDGPVRGRARITFGALAAARGASPTWDHDSATCSVYCHGATLGAGGSATAPVWTTVDGSQRTCGSCHGYPPTDALHPQGAVATRCHGCHPATVLQDDVTIDVAGGQHLDGALDVQFTGGCDGCHGAPPATGAHLVHANPPSLDTVAYGDVHILADVAPSGGARYDFGCGHCHPLDAARHFDDIIDVELAPAGAPVGSLKARNAPGAAFDAGAGTCSGVYCHSSGQETPAYVAAPAWTAPSGSLGCNGCHANPPNYASGGIGAPTANSHVVLSSDGWESGHFGGLPGPWHSSKHGGDTWGATQDAAPITCQTCHADTVDPASAGPSGFYWLDTKGNYDLGGFLGYSCEGCHTGAAGAPPQGVGRVRPLRHVNGIRDVTFDGRTALPAFAGLPAAPNTPTRPYWATVSAGVSGSAGVPDVVADGTTLSMHLASAQYSPSTKTCSNVSCHLQQTQVIWGGANDFASCNACHAFF